MTDRRRGYRIVDEFEQALCEFTGAPFAVATDSCTNALFLSLAWWSGDRIQLPRHNYVGVYQAVVNTGHLVVWTDEEWKGCYQLSPSPIVDSAKLFERDMWLRAPQSVEIMCVSFGSSKRLSIGKGGAVLTSRQDAAEWIRPRTMDGRFPGEDYKLPVFANPAWRCNMTPEQAARGLDLLTYLDDEPDDDWRAYPDISEAAWAS